MLLDENNATIWQSFDHPSWPTDTLFYGQKLVPGQQGGLFSLSITTRGLFAYINSNPPLCYCYNRSTYLNIISYFQFVNQSLSFFSIQSGPSSPFDKLSIPSTSLSIQYMRLEPDGHTRVYDQDWQEVDDLFQITDTCAYPTFCGSNGICTNGMCSCPGPYMGQATFNESKAGSLTVDAPLLFPCLVKLSKITFF